MGDVERVWRSEDLKSGRAQHYVAGLEVPKPAVPKPAAPEPSVVPQLAEPYPAAPSYGRGCSPPRYGRVPFTAPRRQPRLPSPSLSPPSPTLPEYPSFRSRGRGRPKPLIGSEDTFLLDDDDTFLHSDDDMFLPRYRSSYRRYKRVEDKAAQVGSANKAVAGNPATVNQRLESLRVDGGRNGTGSASQTAQSTSTSALADTGSAAGRTAPPGTGKQPHLRLVIPDPSPDSIVKPLTSAGGSKTAGPVRAAQTPTAGKKTMPSTSAVATKATAKAAALPQQNQQKQGIESSSFQQREHKSQGTAYKAAVAAAKPTIATTFTTCNKPDISTPLAAHSQTPPTNQRPPTAALQQKKPNNHLEAASRRPSTAKQAVQTVDSREKVSDATVLVALEPSTAAHGAKGVGTQQKTVDVGVAGGSSARSAEGQRRR